MKVVAKNRISRVFQAATLALALFSLPTSVEAMTCPTVQKSKGGADLMVIGNTVFRRDLNAQENQLGVKRAGIVGEESTGYASIPSADGVAQIVVRDEERLLAISVLSRNDWIITTGTDWFVVDSSRGVSCGKLHESTPTVSAAISQPNLIIDTTVVEITSPNAILRAFGLS